MADPNAALSASTPSSSRLPTVSASDILRELSNKDSDFANLPTGARALDELLQGGLERGKTTELWGPVGAGKTAIALTAASKAISLEKTVIWAACSSSLSSHRLRSILPKDKLRQFYSTDPPSLTHLLAFIQARLDEQIFISGDLLVIDDLNALVDFDYPRQTSFATSSESEARKWQAGRRAIVLANIVSAINRLANTHRLAVIVTNGCATSMRTNVGLGPVLVPAIGGGEWDAGIWNRMAVFQDFNGRFIALQKVQGSGTAVRGSASPVLRFTLSEHGLLAQDEALPVASSAALMPTILSSSMPRKRAFEEVADSEDEEFDWEDFEDSLGSQPVAAATVDAI